MDGKTDTTDTEEKGERWRDSGRISWDTKEMDEMKGKEGTIKSRRKEGKT